MDNVTLAQQALSEAYKRRCIELFTELFDHIAESEPEHWNEYVKDLDGNLQLTAKGRELASLVITGDWKEEE